MFYFTCNESKIYESFTFWNNLQEKKNFSWHSNLLRCTLYGGELIPEETLWPVDVLWRPVLPRKPWKTYLWDRIQNQWSADPVMVDRIIWWFTVSKVADRSSRIRTDDLESAFSICRATVTDSKAGSFEWPLLKPDWLTLSWSLCERNNVTVSIKVWTKWSIPLE